MENNWNRKMGYGDLETVYNRLPLHCVKMIVGDLNAKVGKESRFRPTIGPDSFHNISNENGIRLVNFACSEDLIMSNAYFPRKDIYVEVILWYETRNQIEHTCTININQ